jgi:DNA-binding response OmpR family regulator
MAEATINALLVEDNPGDARLIKEALIEMGRPHLHLDWVERLDAAVARLLQQKFDVVLLDLSLPDSQGLHTVREIERAAPQTPVVVLTGLDDEAVALEAVRAGAQDYLVKSDVAGHLLARVIRYAIERNRIGQRLRQSESRLDALFEHMNSGVAVYRAKTAKSTRNGSPSAASRTSKARSPITSPFFPTLPTARRPRRALTNSPITMR